MGLFLPSLDTFYETIGGNLNLFRVLEHILKRKKILIVSPFDISIVKNWGNRKYFFRNYSYPDFHPALLRVPITYSGLPAAAYPNSNWFETLDMLKNEMSRRDFDIALLSCGSYAMPLGLHARDVLNRSAIYVGGILQLFFGIMGRRYENPFFTDFINADHFIYPLERERFIGQIEASAGGGRPTLSGLISEVDPGRCLADE